MKDNQHILKAKVYNAEVTPEIQELAEKIGIILPSTHTAIFRTIYAPVEEANDNGVRLAKQAVENALPGLVGSQVNLEHLGKGFMVGIILDASLNENEEIETVFTFAKNIYEEDYIRALEKMQEGSLSVSFELLASVDGQEFLNDNTVRLHDIDFQGQGLLIDETPAYKKAIVFDMAKKYKARAIKSQELDHLQEKEMIFANQIVQKCDDVLAQESAIPIDDSTEILWTTITTRVDQHIHVVKIDMEGNGETVGTHGDDEAPHIHKIVNYQIQAKKVHAHRLIEDLLAKRKEELLAHQDILNKTSNQAENKDVTQTNQGGNTKMTEEQKKLVADLRKEFGDHAKDVSDEHLLDEAKVDEIRQAKIKAEADAQAKKDEKSELEVAQERIATLEAENAEMKATLEAKDSEIEAVRENAEKVGKLKVELKDNSYVADFTDENYLDEGKVERAKMQKENDDLKAQNEKLAKEAKDAKDKVTASEKDNDEESNEDEDFETGHDEDETPSSPSKLIARLKK